MDCPQCNNPLMVSDSKLVSEVGSTEVFSELTMVCVNPKCQNYAGIDLSNPKKIVTTIKNKAN
jgi:uncharacterized protein with PIN domain